MGNYNDGYLGGGGGLFSSLDKTTVLQEARLFNETPVNPRKCTQILTKILYLLMQVRILLSHLSCLVKSWRNWEYPLLQSCNFSVKGRGTWDSWGYRHIFCHDQALPVQRYCPASNGVPWWAYKSFGGHHLDHHPCSHESLTWHPSLFPKASKSFQLWQKMWSLSHQASRRIWQARKICIEQLPSEPCVALQMWVRRTSIFYIWLDHCIGSICYIFILL